MAAARSSAGARGKRRRYQHEGDGSRSMWKCHVKQRRSWSWPTAGPERWRAAWRRRSAAGESRGAGGRGKGPKRNFQKLQGPFCKLAITFKIELK